MIAAAALDSPLQVEGFLCAKSARSKKLVLHITKATFAEGD
jgi:primosomal replication protein N